MYLSACVHATSVCLEVRGQLAGVSSLLLPCKSQVIKLSIKCPYPCLSKLIFIFKVTIRHNKEVSSPKRTICSEMLLVVRLRDPGLKDWLLTLTFLKSCECGIVTLPLDAMVFSTNSKL